MAYTEEHKERIIQELVPGKQISLAHIIASPDRILYEKLGLDPAVDYAQSAIGVMTISPAETAIIMADVAMKAAGITIGFVDRFSGSLIVTGTVSEVEAATEAVLDYCEGKLGFTVCPVTKT
ncbi:MAG: BMC domain-containing protein [Eubacteriales bacterium]|nr:BMC domain-containing protein [Eubacteriales bacterium]